jgi:hypothetical protein
MFENGGTRGRSLYSNKRSDCHMTCRGKEESNVRWNKSVNLPGMESCNGALMIQLVGIAM